MSSRAPPLGSVMVSAGSTKRSRSSGEGLMDAAPALLRSDRRTSSDRSGSAGGGSKDPSALLSADEDDGSTTEEEEEYEEVAEELDRSSDEGDDDDEDSWVADSSGDESSGEEDEDEQEDSQALTSAVVDEEDLAAAEAREAAADAAEALSGAQLSAHLSQIQEVASADTGMLSKAAAAARRKAQRQRFLQQCEELRAQKKKGEKPLTVDEREILEECDNEQGSKAAFADVRDLTDVLAGSMAAFGNAATALLAEAKKKQLSGAVAVRKLWVLALLHIPSKLVPPKLWKKIKKTVMSLPPHKGGPSAATALAQRFHKRHVRAPPTFSISEAEKAQDRDFYDVILALAEGQAKGHKKARRKGLKHVLAGGSQYLLTSRLLKIAQHLHEKLQLHYGTNPVPLMMTQSILFAANEVFPFFTPKNKGDRSEAELKKLNKLLFRAQLKFIEAVRYGSEVDESAHVSKADMTRMVKAFDEQLDEQVYFPAETRLKALQAAHQKSTGEEAVPESVLEAEVSKVIQQTTDLVEKVLPSFDWMKEMWEGLTGTAGWDAGTEDEIADRIDEWLDRMRAASTSTLVEVVRTQDRGAGKRAVKRRDFLRVGGGNDLGDADDEDEPESDRAVQRVQDDLPRMVQKVLADDASLARDAAKLVSTVKAALVKAHSSAAVAEVADLADQVGKLLVTINENDEFFVDDNADLGLASAEEDEEEEAEDTDDDDDDDDIMLSALASHVQEEAAAAGAGGGGSKSQLGAASAAASILTGVGEPLGDAL